MATKLNIIGFGETATIVANSISELPLNTTRVCVYDYEANEQEVSAENIEAMVKLLLSDRTPHCAYLLVISMTDRQSFEYAKVFAQHNEMLGEGKPSQVLILEVDMRDALDEERGAKKIRENLVKLEKQVNPKNSHDRRMAKQGYFGVGFFTPGTVFEYQIGRCYGPETAPVRLTVSHLSSNSPNSFIVESTTHDDVLDMKKSVNTQHVKRIIQHVPGRLVWDGKRKQARFAEFFKQEEQWVMEKIVKKHPSRYRVSYIDQLIYTLAEEFMPPGAQLDGKAMAEAIRKMNLFKKHVVLPPNEDGYWGYNVYSVNKKRLQKVVKSLVNKYLVKLHKAQTEYDTMMQEIEEESWEREMRWEEEEDNRRSGVIVLEDSDRHDPKESNYKLGDDVDIGDQVREGLEDVLSPSEQRVEDSHNRMLDEEAEMERYGVTSMADLLLEKVADDWVQAASSYPVNPSLGDLLREKIARDAGKDGKVVLVMDVPENEVGNRADIIFDGGSTIAKLNMTPETIRLVTELNDGVFGKGNWEGGLTPHTADIEAMRDAEDENEFFEVEKNEFGYPQRYQRAHGKEYPVCACCRNAVMPNRGQGSACDDCQAEAMDEASHDYIDSRVAATDAAADHEHDVTDTEFEQMKSDNEKSRERISDSFKK